MFIGGYGTPKSFTIVGVVRKLYVTGKSSLVDETPECWATFTLTTWPHFVLQQEKNGKNRRYDPLIFPPPFY